METQDATPRPIKTIRTTDPTLETQKSGTVEDFFINLSFETGDPYWKKIANGEKLDKYSEPSRDEKNHQGGYFS